MERNECLFLSLFSPIQKSRNGIHRNALFESYSLPASIRNTPNDYDHDDCWITREYQLLPRALPRSSTVVKPLIYNAHKLKPRYTKLVRNEAIPTTWIAKSFCQYSPYSNI